MGTNISGCGKAEDTEDKEDEIATDEEQREVVKGLFE